MWGETDTMCLNHPMVSRYATATIVAATVLQLTSFASYASEDQRAWMPAHTVGKAWAIDANGVRHNDVEYRGRSPWMTGAIRRVAPEYPRNERAQRHQGNAVIRISIDLKTGSVTNVAVLKSTGYAALDRSVVNAYRQWKWPPGQWKQITTGVLFRINDLSAPLPHGATRIPR